MSDKWSAEMSDSKYKTSVSMATQTGEASSFIISHMIVGFFFFTKEEDTKISFWIWSLAVLMSREIAA